MKEGALFPFDGIIIMPVDLGKIEAGMFFCNFLGETVHCLPD